MSPALDEYGQLYAHLTKRRFVTDETCLDRRDLEVVILAQEQLTAKFLDALYSLDHACAPGLIVATDRRDCYLQVLIHSIYALNVPLITREPRLLEFYPIAPAPPGRPATGVEIFGNDSDQESIVKAISNPANVLTVFSHGDGVDAYFGNGVTLCSAQENLKKRPDAGAPYCLKTRDCFRFNRPIDDALSETALIPTERIDARVLVLAVCSGALTARSPIAYDWGFLSQLNRLPKIGAIASTWRIFIANPAVLKEALDVLYSGGQIGHAVEAINKSIAAQAAGFRLAVFGDPSVRGVNANNVHSVRAAMSDSVDGREVASVTSSLVQVDSEELDLRNLFFLKLSVMRSLSHCPAHSLELAELVIAQCNRLERALAANKSRTQLQREAVLIQKLSVDLMLRTRSYHYWLPFAKNAGTFSCGECERCAAPMQGRHFRFPTFAIHHRVIHICPSCGVVNDAPTCVAPLEMSLSSNSVLVQGLGQFSKDAVAALQMTCVSSRRSVRLQWPKDANGMLVETCALPPVNSLEGPHTVAIGLSDAFQFTVISQPLGRPPSKVMPLKRLSCRMAECVGKRDKLTQLTRTLYGKS
jgi:hypothetical protein